MILYLEMNNKSGVKAAFILCEWTKKCRKLFLSVSV